MKYDTTTLLFIVSGLGFIIGAGLGGLLTYLCSPIRTKKMSAQKLEQIQQRYQRQESILTEHLNTADDLLKKIIQDCENLQSHLDQGVIQLSTGLPVTGVFSQQPPKVSPKEQVASAPLDYVSINETESFKNPSLQQQDINALSATERTSHLIPKNQNYTHKN